MHTLPSLNPTFDEYLYVPVHSAKDRITLEAYVENSVAAMSRH